MDIGKRALSLATALVLGATIIGLTAEPVAADKKKPPKDDGTRCMSYGGDSGDDYNFFMPGEVTTDGAGRKYRCGKDGEWHPVKPTKRAEAIDVGAEHTFEQVP